MAATAPVAKAGIFRNLLGGIKWSSILNGTQKTLGIVNQAIPLIKQARPVLNNAKTMFRVMNEFKKVDVPTTSTVASTIPSTVEKTVKETSTVKRSIVNGPTFFQ